MGLLVTPVKTVAIGEVGNPGMPKEAVPSGVGDVRGLEVAVWMRCVKVENWLSNNCLISILNASCEFVALHVYPMEQLMTSLLGDCVLEVVKADFVAKSGFVVPSRARRPSVRVPY